MAQEVKMEMGDGRNAVYLDDSAVVEDDGGVEGAVDAGGGDGEDPGGGVDNDVGVGPVVAAGADDEDALLVGVEGVERDGVGEEVGLEGGGGGECGTRCRRRGSGETGGDEMRDDEG